MSKKADGSIVFNSPPFYNLVDGTLVSNQGAGAVAVRGGKVDSFGQAGLVSGVLESQHAGITPKGSLVYYAIHVNDMYAYLASWVNGGKSNAPKQFPTTRADRDRIVNFAKRHYKADITDPNTLALELKSSWVRVDAKSAKDDFITIVADVPQFTKDSDKKWTWDGKAYDRNVTLALVGFHVVGSVKGHPEMIWATFENAGNIPDANYFYETKDSTVKEHLSWEQKGGVLVPKQKDWLFMDGKSSFQSTNQMHMEMDGNNTVATPNNTISPSNTSRTHPWGSKADKSAAANNTSILSINQNLIKKLGNDVRGNYFLVGATWTSNGVPGVGMQEPVVQGSNVLANATMETYFQFKNCFGCHQGGGLSGLSHIIGSIKPLPLP